MNGYSERSHQLAEELAEKAAENLRRSGKTVERNPQTGRYTVSGSSAKPSTTRARRAA